MFKNIRFLIGIDIGGSKINAILTREGKIFHRVKSQTPKNRKEFLKKLDSAVDHLISATGKKNILGIGCGVAGTLDVDKGIILKSPNISFLNGFDIKKWLERKFSCEVKIDNDARSFTRAEYLFGAGRGYKNIVGMTLGTGIGGGIIINGKMIYGINGSTGEVGHMILNSKFPACAEASAGRQIPNSKPEDFESLAGIKGLRRLGFTNSLKTYQLAKSGDKKAKKAFEELGRHLGVGLANLINILDPEIIVIGGGLSGAYKFFLPIAKKTMAKFIFSPKSRNNVKIFIGKLDENAGAIGAAALFIK